MNARKVLREAFGDDLAKVAYNVCAGLAKGDPRLIEENVSVACIWALEHDLTKMAPAYVGRAVHNAIVDYLRSTSVDEFPLSPIPEVSGGSKWVESGWETSDSPLDVAAFKHWAPEDEEEDQPLTELAEGWLADREPQRAEAFRRVYMDGQSYRTAAEAMGVSHPTVKRWAEDELTAFKQAAMTLAA